MTKPIKNPKPAPITLKDVFNQNRYQLRKSAQHSSEWYSAQAKILKDYAGVTSARMIRQNDAHKIDDKIVPGRLYLYLYDAKHKATLPYWDRYPLVFPYRETEDRKGFYGLNMHYIPYEYRIKILDSLIYINYSNKNNDSMKLQLSWQMIANSSKLSILQPCVHMYLYSQVRSGMKRIRPIDWATAMLLPVQQFVGASNTTVWQNSLKRIK